MTAPHILIRSVTAAACETYVLRKHVSFMRHFEKKYADHINTKYVAEICENH